MCQTISVKPSQSPNWLLTLTIAKWSKACNGILEFILLQWLFWDNESIKFYDWQWHFPVLTILQHFPSKSNNPKSTIKILKLISALIIQLPGHEVLWPPVFQWAVWHARLQYLATKQRPQRLRSSTSAAQCSQQLPDTHRGTRPTQPLILSGNWWWNSYEARCNSTYYKI